MVFPSIFCNFGVYQCVPWCTQFLDNPSRIQGAVHLALVIVFFGRQSLGWVMGNGVHQLIPVKASVCAQCGYHMVPPNQVVVHHLLVKVIVLRLQLIFGEKAKCL